MPAIASAAVNAGLAPKPACDGLAAASSVTGVSPAITASYPATAALSRRGIITSARVDPPKPPAIFRRLRDGGRNRRPRAPVAELVDALDSKSSSARSAGSIPARGTSLRSLRELRLGRPIRSIVAKRVEAAAPKPAGEGGRGMLLRTSL